MMSAGKKVTAEARDKSIVEKYVNDGTTTLDSIGIEHGLTRERVRQIIRDSGVDIEAVAASRKQDALDRHVKVVAKLIAADESIDTLGKLSKVTRISIPYFKENAAAFGAPLIEVGRRRKEKAMSLPRPQEQSYTDEDIYEAMRHVHKINGFKPVTTQMYRESRRTTDPSASLVQLRMGGIINACEAAKVPHLDRRPKSHGFTENDVTEAMERCANELQIESVRLLSFAGYSDWAAKGNGPSGSRVRQIFGNWNNAKMAVKEFS
jgi:acetolactate synthase regulatory subunit